MDDTTVIIVSSPIQSHPDTKILDETMDSILTQLPDSEVIVCLDGVREEQEDKRKNYEEYCRRVLWKANNEWDALPLLFEKHTHQAGMTREALKHVKTPYILFIEHDTPITPDRKFNWEGLQNAIAEGYANVIRFHYEAMIHPEHKYLMLDTEPQDICSVPMMRTVQWSQRPHLASTEWYRWMLEEYFPHDAITMIEDKLYGDLVNAYNDQGLPAWNKFKLWIYTPEGDIKRSYTTDGRGNEPKYGMFFGTSNNG